MVSSRDSATSIPSDEPAAPEHVGPTPVQTMREIRAMLAGAGVRPRKRWGQHFLIDGNLMRRLYASGQVSAADSVLEVGPGTGGLTDLLVAAAGHVVVAEIDPVMCRLLRERFAGRSNLSLIEGDVLAGKHEIAGAVAAALLEHSPRDGGRYMLVANLPYNIATPLLMNLLTWQARGGAHGQMREAIPAERGASMDPRASQAGQVERFCFTVQQEVADRIVAKPQTPDYGPISVAVQATCTVTRVASVPASVFWPAPQVASTMLRIDRAANPFGDLDRLERFVQFVRAAFAHRRKTLRYALAKDYEPSVCAEFSRRVDLSRRPEALSVSEWIELGRVAPRTTSGD